MPPSLNDDALDPGATQPMSPTQPMPWLQSGGLSYIQKQLELEESPVVLELAQTPPDDAGSQPVHRSSRIQPRQSSRGSSGRT